MEQDELIFGAWCDAMAALLALPVEAGDRASVLANLRFIASQIQLLAEFPLDDGVEPAPVFRAL